MNAKKKVFSILFIMILFFIRVGAQNSNIGGIFFTSKDYQKQNSSVIIDFSNKSNKLIFDRFFIHTYIVVKQNGVKIKYWKNKIYALKNEKGEVFRFFKGNGYKILDTSKIYIYSRQEQVFIPYKGSSPHRSGRYETQTVYYFSLNPDSDIRIFTLVNLKMALFEATELNKKLMSLFNSQDQLMEYDNNVKAYKINTFLKQELK